MSSQIERTEAVDLSKNVQKDDSQVMQKEMIRGNYKLLEDVAEGRSDKKVVYTFVPGNLNELIQCFDVVGNYPEINALQSAMQKKTGPYIMEAERNGQDEDVCTYVKADLGMMRKGNIGPSGGKIADPDLLLLSYTGCFTFMKWFEALRHEYNCETTMLHVPYQGDGEITPNMREYVVKQLKEEVIPTLERVSGVKFDIDRLRENLRQSALAEDKLVKVLETAKNKPSPIDSYFGGIYYVGPSFSSFRGTPECTAYYDALWEEVSARLKQGLGPVTPEGVMEKERYRLVVEGPPNYTHMRDFWKMFYDEGAVVVASSYTKVGGVYENGFRHDPENPLESLADYCLGCYTNLNLPARTKMLEDYINNYEADGLLINSIKSCNSFSSGQLLMMNEIEKRTGKPAAFVETDLVDPRYFSASNVKNRLESYFQMIEQKRSSSAA